MNWFGPCTFCMVLLSILSSSSCSKPHTTTNNNLDTLFISYYLPLMRDAACKDSLTFQFIKNLIKGKQIDCRKCNEIVDWTTIYADSSDTSISVTASLDSNENVISVSIDLQNRSWSKDCLFQVFGKSSISNLKPKEYVLVNYSYDNNCARAIFVSGILDCNNKLRKIVLSNTKNN
jgi:hypothetical protein